MPWYSFSPIDTFPHDPGNPNNYTAVGSSTPSCPNPNDYLCAIQAADNSGKPLITQALETQITIALANKVESTNVLLRPTLT